MNQDITDFINKHSDKPNQEWQVEEERPIEPRLRRSWIVDDRRVHLEYRRYAQTFGGKDTLAAEVVVALHDEVGSDASGERGDGVGAEPAQLLATERWPHRVPMDLAVRPSRTGLSGHMDLVAHGGQALGHGLHVD